MLDYDKDSAINTMFHEISANRTHEANTGDGIIGLIRYIANRLRTTEEHVWNTVLGDFA